MPINKQIKSLAYRERNIQKEIVKVWTMLWLGCSSITEESNTLCSIRCNSSPPALSWSQDMSDLCMLLYANSVSKEVKNVGYKNLWVDRDISSWFIIEDDILLVVIYKFIIGV